MGGGWSFVNPGFLAPNRAGPGTPTHGRFCPVGFRTGCRRLHTAFNKTVNIAIIEGNGLLPLNPIAWGRLMTGRTLPPSGRGPLQGCCQWAPEGGVTPPALRQYPFGSVEALCQDGEVGALSRWRADRRSAASAGEQGSRLPATSGDVFRRNWPFRPWPRLSMFLGRNLRRRGGQQSEVGGARARRRGVQHGCYLPFDFLLTHHTVVKSLHRFPC